MVAWFIAAGTAIAGDSPLGIRLLAPVVAALGSIVLVRAADRLFRVERPGLAAAALLNATLAFGVGAVTMTPDTPLLLFWTLAMAALMAVAAHRHGWLTAGAAAGAALVSKYTAVLFGASVFVWLLTGRGLRAWLLRWQPWAAGGIASGLFLPVLWWNATHGWVSFAKQGGRVGNFDPGRALRFLGELGGGQIGLATPGVALLMVVGIAASVRRDRAPARSLLAALTIVPAIVFVEHATGDRVQANWPAVIYPAAAVAAGLLGGVWARLRPPSVVLGLAITLLVYLQGVAQPLALPRRLDPSLIRLGGWPALAAAVAARAGTEGAAFVATDNYGQAAILARLLPSAVPVLGVEPRWAYFNLPDAAPLIAGRAGLLIRSARRADPPDTADWAAITPLGELVRARDGVTAETYRLYHVTGRDQAPEPIVVLPRPR
jgi:4-amino-4-deoxy-L-arabinose transferase-like glycosyltransferase